MRYFDPIFGKITKTVATSYQIFRLKCTKFNFGWGYASHPTGGAYSAPPDPLAGFKGAAQNVTLMILTPSQKNSSHTPASCL